jgi:hypothetical protein
MAGAAAAITAVIDGIVDAGLANSGISIRLEAMQHRSLTSVALTSGQQVSFRSRLFVYRRSQWTLSLFLWHGLPILDSLSAKSLARWAGS